MNASSLYQHLMENPSWEEILREALLAEDAGRERSGENYLGFEWFQVHANQAILRRMVESRVLDITFASRSSTHYKIREPDAVRLALDVITKLELVEPPASTEIPLDLFDVIVGYDRVKAALKLAIQAERPVHCLVSGNPASAKTVTLLELRRLPGSFYVLGASMSRAGLSDLLFTTQPSYLLIDEVDRLEPHDIGVLNSLMATGIVSETKYRRTREVHLDTRVFAAGIRVNRLPADLLSRFIHLHFPPYTESEFHDVTRTVLMREGSNPQLAEEIATAIWQMGAEHADIRQCIAIARLVGDDSSRLSDVMKTLRRYSSPVI